MCALAKGMPRHTNSARPSIAAGVLVAPILPAWQTGPQRWALRSASSLFVSRMFCGPPHGVRCASAVPLCCQCSTSRLRAHIG